MNLKEAFRYQNFLDDMIMSGCSSISNRNHSLKTVKHHKCSAANAEVEDFDEVVVESEEFFANNDVIDCIIFLMDEKERLSNAIESAKMMLGISIDAAIGMNKCRQSICRSLKHMLSMKPSLRKEYGYGQKFNNEGNQIDYKYEVEVESEEAFDRAAAKAVMKYLVEKSDEVSTQIDLAKVNTSVNYKPKFDVNDMFDDVMQEFLSIRDS